MTTTAKQQHHTEQAEKARRTAEGFRAKGDPGNCAQFFDRCARVHDALAAKSAK